MSGRPAAPDDAEASVATPAAAAIAAAPEGAPSLAPSRVKLTWIAALYFASGFPYGLVNELLPVYLRTQRVDVAAIGHVVSLVSWPWALKFVWAPAVDRLGTRKAWIVACQLLIGVVTAALVMHSGATLTAGVSAALFTVAVLSATQDVAIDAYSIELLDERERGPANGVRVTLYRLAMIATSGGLVAASGYIGWPAVFVAAAATMGVLALVTSTVPATRRAAADGRVESLWEPARALLRLPHAWAILLFVLLFRLGDYALQTMIKPFWVDSHYSAQEIGLIQGTVGMVATIVGAVAGGALVPRLGTLRALVSLGAAQAVGSLTYWLVALAGAPRPAMWSASVIEHFTYGLGTAAFLTYLMSVCEKRYAATQFAVLAALFAASRSIGAYFAGDAVQQMGYPNFFLLTFVLALPAWALLPVVRKTVRA